MNDFLVLLAVIGGAAVYECIAVLTMLLFTVYEREPGKPVDTISRRENACMAQVWFISWFIFGGCLIAERISTVHRRIAVHGP
jgi:hypothetical protein